MGPTKRLLTNAQHQQNYARIQGHHADVAILDEYVTAEEICESTEAVLAGEFAEFEILDELRAYIAATYGEHYAKDGVQAFALIAKRPQRGLHFALSNIIKYSDRFGEKHGANRKDLLKVAHYAVLAIYCADKLEGKQ